MKNRLITLLRQEVLIFLAISLFVNLFVWYTAMVLVEPTIKYVFLQTTMAMSKDENILFLLRRVGDENNMNVFIASVTVIFYGILLSNFYVYFTVFISALLSFKSITKLFSFKKFGLVSESSLISEMKLIATWIFLYSIGNLIIQLFGFSGFIYQKLALLCQIVVFYLLIRGNCFGYQIKRRSREIKY
jgi:hypothetical protein